MLQQLGNALAFVLLAGLLPPLILFVNRIFRPHRPYAGKLASYECGEEAEGSAYIQFNNRFYLVAIVFLVFDVEVALLFPVMSLFRNSITDGTAPIVFGLAFSFLAVLFIGLIYEWKRGDIDWVKDFVSRRAEYMGRSQRGRTNG